MIITSSQFRNTEEIPSKFTCDGLGINPDLLIKDVPENAKSLALIVDDPDAPSGTWDHWVIWNIDPKISGIPENSTPNGAVVGKNSWPTNKFGAPCPPNGSHRYFFKLFALDIILNIPESSGSAKLVSAMQDHILAQTELMGNYSRK
ncbi:MAG: YbhB/YbcL family Raf kinase inhibitor-like protein [Patescibacteria group bacterium]